MDEAVKFYRTYFEIDEIRARDRTIIATASTEAPCERSPGVYEVLSHQPGAIDFSRFPLPLVDNHKSADMPAYGRAANPRIVNGGLKVDLVFGSSKLALERWQDAQDGTAQHLSVGYIIKSKTGISEDGVYVVTKWQPLELSVVPVPLDKNAVIGRSLVNTRTKNENGKVKRMRKFFEKKDYSNVDKFFAREPQPTEFLRHLVNAPIADNQVYGNVHPSLRASGLSEGSGSDGGFLAPEGWTDRILYHKWGSKLFPLCNTFKVKHNSMQIPALDDSDRSSGLISNMALYQVEEAGSKTLSKLKLMANQISMKKTCGIIAATDEIINDAVALEQFVFDTMGKAIGWDLDRQIIRGNHADSLLGLLNSPAKIKIQKEIGQNANSLVLENCTKAVGRLTPEALTSKSTVWIVNPEVLPQMYVMGLSVGAGGSSVLPAYRFKGPGESFDTFFSFPVIPSEHCSILGDEGDCILVSLDRFLIATRSLKKATSSSWGFLVDETAFRCVLRSWGQLDHAKTISPYLGGSTLSSVITIADRA